MYVISHLLASHASASFSQRMIYYLLGLALLLVVISWIYFNYPFNMTQGDHSCEGDNIPYLLQEIKVIMRRYLEHFKYKISWNGANSSWWGVCCCMYEAITCLLGNGLPSARSLLAGAAAQATQQDTGHYNAHDNQPPSYVRQEQKQEYSSEEEDSDDEEDVLPQCGRRKNKRKKKQKKRRKHGGRRRQVLRKPIKDEFAYGKESARTFQKRPSAVEDFLRLEREITMTTVLKIDQMVGNALRQKKMN